MNRSTLLEVIRHLRKAKQECQTIDAKRELILKENGDKAEFAKDIAAMANNGTPSHIVIGLADKTFADVGPLAYHYDKNTLNQILADKIDPPVVVEYKEFSIAGNEYGLIEVNGDNPPYIVARDIVHDKTDRKQVRVYKGTIFIRHEDRTVGISRAELEEIIKGRRPEIKVSLERDTTKKQTRRNHFPLILYVHNSSKVMAHDVEVMIAFEGCTLLKCPDFEHNHLADHFGHDYSETTLVVSIPRLLGNSVSEIKQFTLVRKKADIQGIGFLIRGGNMDERQFSVDLAEIDEQYRVW